MKCSIAIGQNIFKPWLPILPYLKSNYGFWLKVDQAWFNGSLTKPDHYGVKLPAIGKFDYHNEGAGFAIIDGGKLIPRYYQNGVLHQFDNEFIQLKPNTWYYCRIELKPLRFTVDGITLHEEIIALRTGWKTPPFCGKKAVGVASRNLKLEIT